MVRMRNMVNLKVECVNNSPIAGTMEAKVTNPRKDTVSREVLRHKEFEDKVRLTRIRDHFICE